MKIKKIDITAILKKGTGFASKIHIVFIMIILMITVLFSGCSRNHSSNSTNHIYSKNINGVLHVFNPSHPQKGIVKLQLKSYLRIASANITSNNPITFSRAYKAKNGNIFISDMKEFKIYEFSPSGKLLHSFLGRGDGPAELPFGLFDLQDFDTNLWVLGFTKVIQFDDTRKPLSEIKLNKRYKNFEMPDETHFIGNYFEFTPQPDAQGKKRHCVCALMDKNEKVQTTFLADEQAGDTHLEKKIDGQTVSLNFASPFITPMIWHHLTYDKKGIYLCLSNQYTIQLKNLQGETLMVFLREYQNNPILEKDRESIVEDSFTQQPPPIKKMIKQNLPPFFAVILAMQPLPNNYLAVFKVSGLNKFEIDLFDSKGYFVYQIMLPDEMMETLPGFSGNKLITIRTKDDQDIYEEYQIIGFPEVFAE